MNTQQQNLINLVNNIQALLARANRSNLGGYIPSMAEEKAIPKLNSWERDFLTNIMCNIQHDMIKQLSPKQEACLEKIFAKVS